MEKFKGPEMTPGQYRSESRATEGDHGDLIPTISDPASRPLGSVQVVLISWWVRKEVSGDRLCCMNDENEVPVFLFFST